MLFLEQRGEFLVATIKHGLHITNPKTTSYHDHQKTAISGTFFENPSKMVRETPQLMLQKEPISADKKTGIRVVMGV